MSIPSRDVWKTIVRELQAGVDMLTMDRIAGETLDEVRRKLPTGLTRMRREPAAGPEIVETWM